VTVPRTKKEIDKEQMYKKLMPSAPKSARPPLEDVLPENAAPLEEILGPNAVVSQPPKRTLEARKISVPALETFQSDVVNAMEGYVLQKLEQVLSRFQCCRCDRCKKDIVALALNKLPPKYRVVSEGQPLPDLDPQTSAQVVTALIQSVIQVRSRPRH
jgi:competence protein ComFB